MMDQLNENVEDQSVLELESQSSEQLVKLLHSFKSRYRYVQHPMQKVYFQKLIFHASQSCMHLLASHFESNLSAEESCAFELSGAAGLYATPSIIHYKTGNK